MNIQANNQQDITKIPTGGWQVTGAAFIKKYETLLWSKVGTQALKHLHCLGLKDDILHKYHVGYNPKEDFNALEYWGLPAEYNSKGNPKKVWLPRGIVIPCYIESVLTSIKILRYLTPQQKSKGEQSDYLVTGSKLGLFGAENIQSNLLVFLADNEIDTMLLDQEVRDLVGAASFGRTAQRIGVADWALWVRYLFPVAHILVPYTCEKEKITNTDSLPFCSRRTSYTYLPNIPNVTTLVELRKSGVEPREWLIQTLLDLGLYKGKPTDISDFFQVEGVDKSDSSNEVGVSIIPNQNLDDRSAHETFPTYKLVTYRFDKPWIFDPKIMPPTPCHCCQYDEYRQLSDGTWICNICHPP